MFVYNGVKYDDSATEQDFYTLLDIINSNKLQDHRLTFAVEALGLVGYPHTDRHDIIKSTLLTLLDHINPIVREGAIYGISPYINDEIKTKLQEIARTDSSTALREVALDAIEEFDAQEVKSARQLRLKFGYND